MLPDKIAFVDLETTGTSATYGRVIEVGILRVEDNKVVKTYNSLINPGMYLPPEIERITGITSQDVAGAPSFRQVADEVLEILEDCVFVAHNVRFDYGFLKAEFKRLNIPFSPKHFCTVKLSRSLYPSASHHNLDAVMERHGIPCELRHRAFNDAQVLFEFYSIIQKQFPPEVVLDAVNKAMKKPSLPLKLKQEDLDALPEMPGVYLFYGENGTPLYVGKSVNIKERVLSHFSGDIHSAGEMKISQQIESIETLVTAGELGALITESHLIKKMLPLFNKKLRLKRELIALKMSTDKHGYHNVVQEVIQSINPAEFDVYIGFFRSKSQVKSFLSHVCKEHGLCEKLLGLEKTSGACFGYRLDNCKGACVQQELHLKYNMRFIEAFSSMKILPWPFPGPIMIEETNPLTGLHEYFLIDKWCYLGSIKGDEHGAQKEVLEQAMQFDLDLYKILRGFLKSEKNQHKIRVLEKAEVEEYMKLNAYEEKHPSPPSFDSSQM